MDAWQARVLAPRWNDDVSTRTPPAPRLLRPGMPLQRREPGKTTAPAGPCDGSTVALVLVLLVLILPLLRKLV